MEMSKPKLGYDAIKFYDLYDLGIGRHLKRVEAYFASFDLNKDYTNINEIIEMYNIQRLMDSNIKLSVWTDEQYNNYKGISLLFTKNIGKFFSKINNNSFLEMVTNVFPVYVDDFWTLFDRFKVFNHVSGNVFKEYLQIPNTALHMILQFKRIVNHYGPQIAEVMRTSDQTAPILISKYLESTKTNYLIPLELKPEEFESILLRYIESGCAHPNDLQLIYNGQSSRECPISDRLRLQAKRALKQFWNGNTCNKFYLESGICIRFTKLDQVKEFKKNGRDYQFLYDIDWLEENLDYPTILNNFIYVFEMFDISFRSSLVSVKSQIGSFERLFIPKGIRFYCMGSPFDLHNYVSIFQTKAYYDLLKNHNIDLEEVFKWFFESYLVEEFEVYGFSMTASSLSATYVEKCRSLASEMDGVLKQFRMYVQDGEIDRELFEMSSEHIVIGNIPSLISKKYAYPNSEDIQNEMRMLFSDQTALSCIEKTNSEYHTLFHLLQKEEVILSDFNKWQQDKIQWLIDRGDIFICNSGTLKLIDKRIRVLEDLYEHDVICIHHSTAVSVLDEMISKGDLRVANTLFTEPERDYLNYILNKSEFSNGLDLRNKYVHGTYPLNEDEQQKDYMIILRTMDLIITKINDEFCTIAYSKRGIS